MQHIIWADNQRRELPPDYTPVVAAAKCQQCRGRLPSFQCLGDGRCHDLREVGW